MTKMRSVAAKKSPLTIQDRSSCPNGWDSNFIWFAAKPKDRATSWILKKLCIWWILFAHLHKIYKSINLSSIFLRRSIFNT